MWWIVFPILASVFYTTGGYVQNFLTDVALPKKRGGALILMRMICFVFSIIVLIAMFGRAIFMMPLISALGLMLAGAINIIGSVYYYKAIQKGDNIDVNIFGQVGPLLSILFGILILGESINVNQALGFLFIMGGALLVVFGTNSKRKGGPDFTVAILTLISCTFSILSDIVYAYFIGDRVATMTVFAQGFFFFQIGSLLMVLMALIFFRKWRKAVKTTFFTGHGHQKHLAIELLDNATFLAGDLLYKFGLLAAPVVALVSPIGKVAGLFSSFFIVLIFGRAFPKFITAKRMTKKIILTYIVAAIVIVTGIVIMNS